MKILVNICHPAHVHLFKNFIRIMEKRGHSILIMAIEKEVTAALLKNYGFNYISLGEHQSGFMKKVIDLPLLELLMYKHGRKYKPDVVLGLGSIYAPPVSKLLRSASINFDDDEYSYPYYNLFADAVCGFSGFKKIDKKIIKINGYKELAYLHPNHFRADGDALNNAGILEDEEFVLLRFVGWNAYHDIGKKGFDLQMKRKLVEELKKHAKVLISSESSLPKEFERYKVSISPEKMHDLLYHAKLLICDSQTMTTEAGVLGTPAIRCNSFVGDGDMLNFIELENNYGLIYNYHRSEIALEKALELVQKSNLKEEWKGKRSALLRDKIDVTSFMVWFVENYPESFEKMKQNNDFQDQFR